ncbi:epidermal growth factor receptor kinase substrate 8-like protein 2 isoform X2 [Argonauta hians]
MPVGNPHPEMNNFFSYNGYDNYRQHEDPYRYNGPPEVMHGYPREDSFRHNGPRSDYYGSGGSMNTPTPYSYNADQSVSFEVDHLATFSMTSAETQSPEAGISKLSNMANTSGIWTMKCTLSVERTLLKIHEKGSAGPIDCFHLTNIHKAVAINKPEKCDVYNNLVVLMVINNSNRENPNQMHIFLAGSIPAQEIVDEIHNAKAGRPLRKHFSKKFIPPPPTQPAPEPPNHMMSYQEGPPLASSMSMRDHDMGRDGNTERDGQLLNHCFDDIEKFVARLQKAAESYKELERLKKDKGGKDKKGRQDIEKLSMSAVPPQPQDFVDIFQKFKLSFNLLAKLKGCIHDPNAPELVHFIFTPLSIIYEASRDPTHGNRNLAANVYSPMITAEAKELLLNCLTSKEVDLWMSFGEGWTTSREDYKGEVPPYTPRFYNGWHPAPTLDDYPPQQMQPIMPKPQPHQMRQIEPPRSVAPPHEQPYMPDKIGNSSQRYNGPPIQNVPDSSSDMLIRAQRERGAKFCEVTHSREKKNNKELTVMKGDILEILDDSRNWWKLRNNRGQVGHAPYTILTRQLSMGPPDNGPGNRNAFRNNSQHNPGVGSSMKGELRYF